MTAALAPAGAPPDDERTSRHAAPERPRALMADDGRTYIRVHDGVPDHPKVEPLSDKAFRLLIETWCWSSRHLTDGRVPRAIWTRRGTPAARKELVTAGLAVDLGADGVQMHDYLEHQRSRSQVEDIVSTRRAARAAASVKANHQRWHLGAAGKPSTDCPLCYPDSDPESGSESDRTSGTASDRTPDRIGERTPSGSHIGIDRGIGTVLPRETRGGGAADSTADDAPAAPPIDPTNPRCARHRGIPVDDPGPNCRTCRAVRLDVEARHATAADPAAQDRARRDAWRAAVDACPDCDDNGKYQLPDGSLTRHHDLP